MSALVSLAGEAAVKGSAEAARNIAWALCYIAEDDVGRSACVSCGAVSALVSLAGQAEVKCSAEAARRIANALSKIRGLG